jgi:hypothetical protein
LEANGTEETSSKAEATLSSYPGPCAFLLPGNHDWFDGLATYTRYILSRDWLGGWLMPQRTSYFALKLPHGWWILGCDLALDNDINIEQFQFFAKLAASMRSDDCVIIVSHVPHWVLNEYENHADDDAKETHLSELVRTHMRGRVKLRLAGDLHHYTRHVPISVKKSAAGTSNPILIVAGGGGAVSFACSNRLIYLIFDSILIYDHFSFCIRHTAFKIQLKLEKRIKSTRVYARIQAPRFRVIYRGSTCGRLVILF